MYPVAGSEGTVIGIDLYENNLLFKFPLKVRRAIAQPFQQCRIKVVTYIGWQANKLLPPNHFPYNHDPQLSVKLPFAWLTALF